MDSVQNIQYIGEHLLPGQIGYFSIIFGFVTSLLAATAYFWACQRRHLPEGNTWRTIGRLAFILHSISIFLAMGIIFYLLTNHFFEYEYVRQHASEDLPFRYTFSAFWEGQEGSFLLWLFWHAVLGLILMATAKKWESPVLAIIALIQAVIFTMILGLYVYIGDESFKIGSNPFLLVRDLYDLPIFASADYVNLLSGTGLNPLLQNYWMTIHPPTLFLGFASTVIPFGYAIAGLWMNQHKEWLAPVLPWALFSASILGIGILMGGAWAYEALSFGGYWAWDPVENASLVPWIILVAGIHTNMIARNTGHSIRSTYVYYLLTFILIVYSTALTRSGILGDTSVHAFTEMGLEVQLALFITIFTALASIALLLKYKEIPNPKKEESIKSREFWMFMGSLVFLFSAILITFTTSIPLYKKVASFIGLDLNITSPLEPVAHYNKYQLWIAVFIGLLSGAVQFLRYKEFNWSKHRLRISRHWAIGLIITTVLTILAGFWINLTSWQYGLLLFSGIFAIVSNIDYLFSFLKGNMKVGGSTLSHVGFGLMVIGILASGLNKRHISSNPVLQRHLLPEEYLAKNVMLIKNRPMFMNGFEVTYTKDTLIEHTRKFEVRFKKLDDKGHPVSEFTVYPDVLYTNDLSEIAAPNPDTKHYLHKDIFTHIADLPPVVKSAELRKQIEDSLDYRAYLPELHTPFVIHDTIRARDTFAVWAFDAVVESIAQPASHPEYEPRSGDLTVGVKIAVRGRRLAERDSVYFVQPMVLLRNNLLYNYPVQINDLNIKIKLEESILDQIFAPEEDLDYQLFALQEGDQFSYNGYSIQFLGFERDIKHSQYTAQEQDVAVAAVLQIEDPDTGQRYMARPVYLIRGNRPFNLKDQVPDLGLHLRFTKIDPATGTIDLNIARSELDRIVIPLQIATNATRDDYIIFEAIEFPGINLFWIGSTLMLFGLGFSIWHRLSTSKSA